MLIMCLAFIFVAQIVSADSLWQTQAIGGGSMFVDKPAPTLKENDLIFVVIDEETNAQTDADTEASVDDSVEGSISSWFSVEEWTGLFDFLTGNNSSVHTSQNTAADLPSWGMEVGNDFKGEGETVRNNSVTARIAARVITVKPNGTFLLEGQRHVQVNGETTILTIRGTARNEDVSNDNVILSSQLADLSLVVDGKGIIKNVNRQGIASWLMNFLR